ncbi:hypothetical protein Btru_022890 [Bulinus truncatus]|nr:hypothetical protein Btru_022890 [Bulinus truncatus]
MKHLMNVLGFTIAYFVTACWSKNVVFLPFIVSSHAMTAEIVANELEKHGHQIFIFLPSAYERRRNERQTDSRIKTFSYNIYLDESEDILIEKIEQSIFSAEGNEPDFSWIATYPDFISEKFVKALSNATLVEFIKNMNPDLIVLDTRLNDLLAIPYALNIPFAILSPMVHPWTARVPTNLLDEAYNIQHFKAATGFYDKFLILINLLQPMFYDLMFDYGCISQAAKDKPYISGNDLMSKAEVYVIASDHIVDFPKPSLPNVKYIGAVTPQPGKKLEKKFKIFMEMSTRGVAVVSFGSLFVNFPPFLSKKMLEIFAQLPLDIVWRSNITSPYPDRMMTSTWIPQNDLLAHTNTKVFISHCGAHSQYEAVYHAVPVICIPLFYDQHANSERFEFKNFSLTVNIWRDSRDRIVTKIKQVVENDFFKKEIAKKSEIYRLLFNNSRSEAAFWLNHVMKYGGDYMRIITNML